ncbi:MAG TPA: HNH endonuclease [Ktedonobacteraceae bacterium]|nr:HNH endonuclease [Ktedonobacteraceae bacterium]
MQGYKPKHYASIEAYHKAEYQKHRERYIVKAHKRRALILNAPGNHTAEDIRQQFKRQKGKCHYCHNKLAKYHIEHVVPVTRGGSNDMSNIVLACPPCNWRKGNKLPHEWPEGGRLL